MDIHIFQSHQGDCLMVEDAANQHRILCDGGTPQAMRDYIAPQLTAWQAANKKIDCVYISHIDEDHIGGIVELLDLLVQWKVFDYHVSKGDKPAEPALPRPPNVGGIWHNSFRDMLPDDVGDIEALLAASAPLLQVSQVPRWVEAGREYAQIATSVKQALTVSRLVRPDLLGVQVNELRNNPKHSGKLLLARSDLVPEQFGGLAVSIICPSRAELGKLRKLWKDWLSTEKNQDTARKIRDAYAGALGSSAVFANGNPIDLGRGQGDAVYKGVTVPNIASTVLLVEEKGKTLLLTGDSHADMIVDGLRRGGRLSAGHLHLDVLKYPHHGAKANVSDEFLRLISADHYNFCGDGSHTNPELSVLKAVLDSRVGPVGKRVQAPQAKGRPFKFWFSTSPHAQKEGPDRDHMQRVLVWAEAMALQYPGEFDCAFGNANFMTVSV